MSETRWGAYVTSRLDDMEAGRGDWTDLTRPSPATIQAARDFAAANLPASAPTPSVVPGEGGSVLFVWHKLGWDAEIEVLAEGTGVWARNRATEERFTGSWPKVRFRATALLEALGKDGT